jgi:hypothetical protein
VVISAFLVRFRQSDGRDQVSNRWNYTSIVRERDARWRDVSPALPLSNGGRKPIARFDKNHDPHGTSAAEQCLE